jgi:spore coat protein CotH
MDKMALFRRLTVGFLAPVVLLGILSSPAQAATALTLTDIYNPLKVLKAELSLPSDSVASLNNSATFKVYVPATLILSVDGKSSGIQKVTTRLKGSTSLFSLDETPSFKIKFKKGPTGLGFLGLRRLTLNGLVQDNSKIHEFGAYNLFNAMGIPASKTGWARLYINGVDRGLYVNVEQPDQAFMAKRFKDVTQHIYEGIAFKDLKLGNDNGGADSGSFLADYGWKVTPNKNDLTKLINYASDWEDKTWYQGLLTVTDRNLLIRAFAVENFLGHWDSYSGPDINNYFLRSNTRNKFTYIPWGTDQTFGENRKSEVLGDTFYLPLLSERADQPWAKNLYRGKLYVQCINYKPCRTQYLLELKAVSAMATKIKLGAQMRAVAAVIEPVLAVQYAKDQATLTLAHKEQARSILYIARRQAEVKALLKQYKIK